MTSYSHFQLFCFHMLAEISTFEESNDAGLNISLANTDTMILDRLFADL